MSVMLNRRWLGRRRYVLSGLGLAAGLGCSADPETPASLNNGTPFTAVAPVPSTPAIQDALPPEPISGPNVAAVVGQAAMVQAEVGPPGDGPVTASASQPQATPPLPATPAAMMAESNEATVTGMPASPTVGAGVVESPPADPEAVPAPAPVGIVTISAGALERRNSIVSFELPPTLAQSLTSGATAVNSEGNSIPVQVEENGTATLIVPQLAASQTLALELFPVATTPSIHAVAQEDGVHFQLEDKTLFRFITTAQLPAGLDDHYRRGGYIHPLLTPSGARLTGDYPSDHPHHHGIWSAWREVEFDGRETDFWNTDDEKGLADFRELEASWSGPVHAGLRAQLMQTDLTSRNPVDALRETWALKAYRTHEADAPYFVFDITSAQTPAQDIAIELSKYLYGGFGIRGREDWSPGNSDFLTSEGLTRANGEDTGAHWVYYGGRVKEERAGMALLGHPDNFRAPQKVRLHPEMPYFSYAPVKAGGFTIEPGQTYMTRFRVVTFDGEPDAEVIQTLWQDYAQPATATFTP